jgi:methyl-accepting chemotaxis protein
MSSPRIEVEIVAKVEGLTAGVNTATGQLDKLGKSAEGTAPKFGRLSDATRNYNAVGVNFARLIQDAPFGIIGVGNNITALAESFDQARNKGQSFTQILGGIFSSGNLVTLGISALVTAWTLYEQNAKKAESITDKTSEAFKELSDQIDKTASTLATVEFASKIVEDQLLLIKSTDKTSTIFRDFGTATEEAFQKLNPQQLTQIKTTFQELANVQIQNIGNQLGYNRKQVLEFIASLKGNTAEFEKLDPKIRDSVSSYNSLQEKVKIAGGQLEFFNDKAEKLPKGKTALEKYSEKWDEFNLRQEIAREFQDKLTESTKNYQKEIDKVARAIGDVQKFGKQVSVKIKTEVEGFEEETAGPMPFKNFLDLVAFQLDKLPQLEERVSDFAKTINDLLKGSVTDAFIDLGYTIGETLASGGNVLKAVGGSLLKSFGKFLGQFGQQLIAYGVAASAFGKVSLALANPGSAIIAAPLAIAAGIALTAIAGVIGGLGRKGPGGGGGGGGAGGGSAAAGGTSFAGGGQGALFQQNRDLNGELVVRGQDLVYVFGQANDRINKG